MGPRDVLPARLHLVRHGETYWNEMERMQGWQDSALTSKGRYTASLLAFALGRIPLRAVYASTSARAIATAGILVAGRDLPIRTSDDLREIGLGGWEGRPAKDIAVEEPSRFRDFRERPDRYEAAEGGETFAQVQQRVTAFVKAIAAAHAGEEVLIVSHSIALKVLLAAWDGTPLAELWETPELQPCSHSIVEVSREGHATLLQYAGERRRLQKRAKALAG
jgi:broad specificity phosphatase PhoE